MSPRSGREGGRPGARPRTGDPQAIRTAADVRRLLSEQIMQLTTNPDLDPLRATRQVAQLARVALQAMELDNLNARVEAMEATLKIRRAAQTKEDTL
jgi:hypothetical protein